MTQTTDQALFDFARHIEMATGCDPLDPEFEVCFQMSTTARCQRCARITATAILIDDEMGEVETRTCERCAQWW